MPATAPRPVGAASRRDRPRVSCLVAMRNEERSIARCLASLFAQDYPAGRLEIWVLDGQSTDSSWALVARLIRGRPNCHLLANAGVTQAAGWNLGLARAGGDIVGIISGHAELAPDYVAQAVATLQRSGAAMVGGPARAHSGGAVGEAIALATSSPFGVGGARFHYTDREEDVDTVFMGLWWRALTTHIGGFDEEMVRNQDDELSYRLRAHGGRIVCNPAIRSYYYNRATIPSLWRQYFQYGYWKVRVMQKHPWQMRPRQFAPPLLVATLCGGALAAALRPGLRRLWGAALGLYVCAGVGAAGRIARQAGWRHLPLLPVVFATLHVSYGLGFLAGLVRFAGRWRRTKYRVPSTEARRAPLVGYRVPSTEYRGPSDG